MNMNNKAIDDLINQIDKKYECQKLTKHSKKLFEDIFSDVGEEDIKHALDKIVMPKIVESEYKIYSENKIKEYSEKFSIPISSHESIFSEVELCGRFYIFYTIIPFITEDLNYPLAEIKKISDLATKLKQALPEDNDSSFQLINILNGIETNDLQSNQVSEFLSFMKQGLSALEELPLKIPNSKGGDLLKIGVKSPKGNIALKVWIMSLYDIWTIKLDRSFKYDGPQGVNGRKRFTDLAYECLLPIHETIEYETVKYAVRSFATRKKASSEHLTA